MTPPVILLHGWTMRGAVFGGLVERLPDVAFIAPDLPGHGASAHLPPTLDSAADMLAAIVDASPSPPVVVGWSMGAAVAWRHIARSGTGGLAGLITIDMSPRIAPARNWDLGLIGQTAEGLAEATCQMKTDWPGAARAIAATMFARGNDPRPFGRDEALDQIMSEDAGKMRAFWADLLTADARHVVADISCTWLVAYGAQSRAYGESVAGWLASRSQGAEVVRFEASGHSVHLEEADAFAGRLKGFLQAL